MDSSQGIVICSEQDQKMAGELLPEHNFTAEDSDIEEANHESDDEDSLSIQEEEQWPRSYRETVDSISIAASPGSTTLLRQATSFIQSRTQSKTNLFSSHQDLGVNTPLLIPSDQIQDISSTCNGSSVQAPESQDTSSHRCNVTQTVFNGFSVFVGIGLLSVPSTIQEGGWASMGFLTLYAGLCIYTSFLLTMCMKVDEKIASFPDLGRAVFGKFGRVATSMIFYIELYFCCVEFVILEAENGAKLFPHASFQWGDIYLDPIHSLGIIAVLLVLPTCFIRDFRKISFISACGALGVAFIALSLVLVGTKENVGFHQSGPLVKWNGIPYALGVFGFCYSGHSVLPHLYHSMSEKKEFPKALIIIFVLSLSTYLFVAITGFLMFGEDTLPQITLNLPTHSPATTMGLWMTVLSPLFKYPLMINPLARSLEELLPSHLSDSWWCIVPLRTALVFSSVCVAFLVPFFGYVMAFAGSLLCLLAATVVPALAYIEVVKPESNLQRISCYAVIAIGLTVAAFGTYSSAYNIIQSLSINST